MERLIRRQRSGAHRAMLAGAALLFCVISAGEVYAQFGYHYGGACAEAGRSVEQVSEGGFIVAGETSSIAAGCASSDIYVVRTHNNGALFWSRTYSIDLNDVAHDIAEVVDGAGAFDGFVITGSSDNVPGCGDGNKDAFLLKIDRCGNVQWVRTYGELGRDEFGYDILQSAFGMRDYIVAGTKGTAAGRNGMLLRVNRTGGLVWGWHYDGPGGGDDYFNGLDEATAVGASDIIAVGGTNSSFLGGYNTWIVRVGSGGVFVAGDPRHNALAYGASNFEDLSSVDELTTGTSAGNIITTGRYTDPAAGNDVLLVQYSPNPCGGASQRTIRVNNMNNSDEGFCVREIPVAAGFPSEFVVAGYHSPGVWGLRDMFLHRFNAAYASGAHAMYGGAGNDEGRSVAIMTAVAGCHIAGFVLAGFLDIAGADPSQMYVVWTDAVGDAGTCDLAYNPIISAPAMTYDCRRPTIFAVGGCTPSATTTCPTWGNLYCGTSPTRCTIIPACTGCGGTKPNLEPEAPEYLIDFSEGVRALYPNPVLRGDAFTVEYGLSEGGEISVMVSDIAGRMVYNHTAEYAMGSVRLPLSTEGWASGVYMVRLTVDGHSYTRSVVVVEN